MLGIGAPVRSGGVRRTPFADGFNPPSLAAHPALVGVAAGSEPDAASLVEFSPPVMDQRDTSECEGHGWSGAVYERCGAMGGPLAFVPSPEFLYKCALALERAAFPDGPREPLGDDGTDSPAILRALESYGVKPMHPNAGQDSDASALTVTSEPSLTDLLEADKTRFVGGHAIYGSPAECTSAARRAIGVGRMPLIIEAFVDSRFMRATAGDVLGPCDRTDPRGGWHCMRVTAYRTRADGSTEFLLTNSWGIFWGDGGRLWVTSDFVATARGLYAVDVRRAA